MTQRNILLTSYWALPGARATDPYRYLIPMKRSALGGADRASHASIPDEFDSRKQWPYCPTLHEIFEQGKCASCWATVPADVVSDRICIATGGRKVVRISAGNLLACCRGCGRGCDGGYPGAAWLHWQRKGVVTGSRYSSSYVSSFLLSFT